MPPARVTSVVPIESPARIPGGSLATNSEAPLKEKAGRKKQGKIKGMALGGCQLVGLARQLLEAIDNAVEDDRSQPVVMTC
jgi:hypothetical protein